MTKITSVGSCNRRWRYPVHFSDCSRLTDKPEVTFSRFHADSDDIVPKSASRRSLQARLGPFSLLQGHPRSISQPLIDNVLQGFALLKPAILLQKEAHRLILPVGRVVRAVRRQQNILQLVQQMSRR